MGCELLLSELPGPDLYQRLFGRRGPVELEIGCGKGRFVIRCAESMPETGFIAVERANRFYRVALQRANRRQLDNLKLVRTDALYLMRCFLPTASVRSIHVLFPDPWPKKRHHKRRLFSQPFLEAVERVLEDRGFLNLATDHEEYFAAIEELMQGCGKLLPSSDFALADRLPEGEAGLTNYEVKYRRSGRVIRQASWWRQERAQTS